MRKALLTAFGFGLLPGAPGTWGSLPVPVLAALAVLIDDAWLVNVLLLLLFFIASIATVRFGAWAEAHWNRHDPPCVVSDEIAGQSLALLFVPWSEVVAAGSWWLAFLLLAVGFVAFRFFDITKIPPAKQFQDLPRGWGILADDMAAGLYAGIATWALAFALLA